MKKILLTLVIAVSCILADAQTRLQKLDSIYYENLFTPNFSSLLMPKGFVEVIVSNSLLSANKFWQKTGGKIDMGSRSTYDYTTAIVNIGMSKNTRFNAGLELHYNAGYNDSDEKSSMFNIFKNSAPGYVSKASALTSIGPRIKWRPFKHNLNFVYITTLQLPTLSNFNKELVLGQQRTQWGNTFLYNFAAGKKLAFFIQDDLSVFFKKGSGAYNIYSESINFYGYLLVSKHIFPFVSIGYAASLAKPSPTESFQMISKYLPAGIGLQYQYSLRFTVNAYYNQYLWASNTQDFRTFNLGVRKVF